MMPRDNFVCPITQDIMIDPVIAKDGCSYERQSITQWLKSNSRSPTTNEELSCTDLVPNRALRTIIEDWKSRNLEVDLDMKTILDDFKPECDGWRLAHQNYPCDWTLKISGPNNTQYPVNLALLSPNSEFFSRITEGNHTHRFQPHHDAAHETEGEVQIDSAVFNIPKIGRIADTLKQLKRKVQESTGVSRLRQRFSFLPKRDPAEPAAAPALELQEDWKRLSDYGIRSGDRLRLQVDPPWHRIDAANKTVVLTLPPPCRDAFEACLDHLCDRDRARPLSPALAPGDALALVWLAGHLGARQLKDELLAHLELNMSPSSAHSFLGPALSLGLDRVAGAARDLAARRLDAFPAAALCSLPLEEFEDLINSACRALPVAGRNSAGSPAWAPAWAAVTYLGRRHRSARADSGGGADRRLAALVVLGVRVGAACDGGPGDGNTSAAAWPATADSAEGVADLVGVFHAAESLQDAALRKALRKAWARCAAANFGSVSRARPGLEGLPAAGLVALLRRADLEVGGADAAKEDRDGLQARIFEGRAPSTWEPRPEDAVFAAV